MRKLSLCFQLSCGMLFAHAGKPIERDDLWTEWQWDPGVVAPLLAIAFLYARGSVKVRLRQRACFWGGWTILALALVSPLHPLGEALFSAHMVQHELLMLIAAPLLVLSRPLAPLLLGMPSSWRRRVGGWTKRAGRISTPAAATILHGAAIWIWHEPRLFQATLSNDWIHAAQHVSFFGSALLFWWSLTPHCAVNHGAAVLYLFVTAVHTSILGALLTFSRVPLYAAYRSTAPLWGFTALEDQQLGGLIMWVPGGLIYLAVGLLLFAAWLRESGSPSRVKEAMRASSVLAAVLALSSCIQPRSPLADGESSRGEIAIYRYGCNSCHTIKSLRNAHGLVGPPLDGIRDRLYVAGILQNNAANMKRWIQNPQSVNDKTAMPNLGVTPEDAADITAYLYSK